MSQPVKSDGSKSLILKASSELILGELKNKKSGDIIDRYVKEIINIISVKKNHKSINIESTTLVEEVLTNC